MTKKVLLAAALVLALGISVWLLLRERAADTAVIEATGTVEATEADLGFQLPGRLAEVLVGDGDEIFAGQRLASLDLSELHARKAAIEAQVAVARAQLAELESGARPEEVRQAQAALAAAEQRLDEASRVLARTRRLEADGAASREALEHAETAFEVARATAEQARQQLELVRQGVRRERLAVQRAAVAQAEAAVAQVEAALDQGVIRSPFDGIVTLRHRQPGETVAPGLPVLTIMDPDDRWVRVYLTGEEVAGVAIGQEAVISGDGLGDREFAGRVVFMASRAEFTPRNVQTAKDRVKLVYAVRVAITGDPRNELKPGMPAEVRLPRRLP